VVCDATVGGLWGVVGTVLDVLWSAEAAAASAAAASAAAASAALVGGREMPEA